MIKTINGKYNITKQEIINLNSKIKVVNKFDDKVVIEYSPLFTEKEDNALNDLFNSKEITIKEEYNKLTTNEEKINFLAKNIGAI